MMSINMACLSVSLLICDPTPVDKLSHSAYSIIGRSFQAIPSMPQHAPVSLLLIPVNARVLRKEFLLSIPIWTRCKDLLLHCLSPIILLETNVLKRNFINCDYSSGINYYPLEIFYLVKFISGHIFFFLMRVATMRISFYIRLLDITRVHCDEMKC